MQVLGSFTFPYQTEWTCFFRSLGVSSLWSGSAIKLKNMITNWVLILVWFGDISMVTSLWVQTLNPVLLTPTSIMDGVKVALGNTGMTVKAARQCAIDRTKWRVLVHM